MLVKRVRKTIQDYCKSIIATGERETGLNSEYSRDSGDLQMTSRVRGSVDQQVPRVGEFLLNTGPGLRYQRWGVRNLDRVSRVTKNQG